MENGLDIIFQVIILVLSVVIHEVTHGHVANILGDPTAKIAGRLSLNPLKHLDLLGSFIVPLLTSLTGMTFGWAKPVPVNPYNLRGGQKGEAIVAAAGPLSNLLIAIIFGLLIRFGAENIFFTAALLRIMVYIILINIVLFVFNLMPVPPLDGSKVLFAALPPRFSRIEYWAQRNSLILLIVFIFFLWQYFEPVVESLFLLITGGSV